jgi:hypothetical protein
MAKRKLRTDPHRPGEIVPADYEYVFSYNGATTQNNWPIPSYKINCELDRRHEILNEDGTTTIKNGQHDPDGHCCVIGLNSIAKVKWGGNGGTLKCSICGTHFVYGDVWRHIPTGEYVHLGHTCADKYNLLADRSAWHKEHGRLRQAAAVECEKERRKEDRDAFLSDHPGLREALDLDHHILQDMFDKLNRFGGLSEKQISFALKLANEIKNPEPKTDAPEGRIDFVGEVVGHKVVDSPYGLQNKITVKVTTDQGFWYVTGTCPKILVDEMERGKIVNIRATLTRSKNNPHFAFMKRPSGRFVEQD